MLRQDIKKEKRKIRRMFNQIATPIVNCKYFKELSQTVSW